MNPQTHPSFEAAAQLLRQAGLRQTACRLMLLTRVLDAGAPIPLSRLEQQLDEFDRVTIYRTLQAFLQAGLVHRTSDSGGHPYYAPGAGQNLRRSHAHFECQQCSRIFCFDWDDIPRVILPSDFVLENIELRLRGLCDRCNKA